MTHIEMGGHEFLVVSKDQELVIMGLQGRSGSLRIKQVISLGQEYKICAIYKQSIVCVTACPNSEGLYELKVLDIKEDAHLIRQRHMVDLKWKALYDICTASCTAGDVIVLCSAEDESVAAVQLASGHFKWRVTEGNLGVSLYSAHSIMAGTNGRLFLACPNQHNIYTLNVEDGAFLYKLNLDPQVFYPTWIWCQGDDLHVAHLDANEYQEKQHWKWKISKYRMDVF